MKFVYHNLKMLMNRTRYNGWVLGELFVVFIVLWFLCDSIGVFHLYAYSSAWVRL